MKTLSNIILLLFLTGISYGGEIDKQNSKGHVTYQREPKQIVQIVGDGAQSNIGKAEGENLGLTGPHESNQVDLKNQNRHVGVKSESSNIEKDHMLPKETKKLPPQNASNGKRNLKSGKKETSSPITASQVVMTIATVLMAIATWLIWQSNKLSNRILMAESQPIISFEVDRSATPSWIIRNVGKGTALNVLVAHKQRDGVVERPIRNYNSLEPGKWLRIHWKYPNIFIAQYQDVYRNNFTVECGESINTYQEGKRYKDWDGEKKKQLWQMIAENEVQFEHNQIHKKDNQANAADS